MHTAKKICYRLPNGIGHHAQNNAQNALKLQPQAPFLKPENTQKRFGLSPSQNGAHKMVQIP